MQENPWKPLRHRRAVNPTDVKPQEIVERFSREIKNLGSEANRVQSVQVTESIQVFAFYDVSRFKSRVNFTEFKILRRSRALLARERIKTETITRIDLQTI